MILSNTEIVRCLSEGSFSINPLAHSDPTKSPFNTSAVDLRLGNEILAPEDESPVQLDLSKSGIATFLAKHSKPHIITKQQPYSLGKGKLILAKTLESVSFPIVKEKICYGARVEGKSSLARCGILVHFTAPTIHVGFEGTVTLEIMNFGVNDFLLTPEMFICQLIIEEVKGSPVDAPNQFKGQNSPAGVV